MSERSILTREQIDDWTLSLVSEGRRVIAPVSEKANSDRVEFRELTPAAPKG